MFFTKIKITVAVILAVGTLGTGAGVATYHTVVANHAGANATSEDASPDIGKKAEREQRKPVEAPNKEASDEDRMQGTWRARSVVHQENPVFRFTGNKFSGGFYSECFFKLDPTKQPKEIDLILRHGITIRGIFAFEGQTLKLSFYSGGSEDRPRGFGAEPMPDRSGHYVLQREPAEAKRKPLPAYFSKLKPEERAFAIRVPAVCIASFMTAGDKVDVIATEGSAAPRTILRGVKVLAVENVGHPDRASMKLLTLGINAKEIETVAIHVDTATLHVIAHPSKDKFRLAPNERAMNIKVANFDLVKSGDRVDVLATQGRARQAKIIAENLEVLADRGSSAEGVTLRVTPEQAEQLSFHAAIGVVRLLVRGPDK